jgi:sec-independent protein translocase protein TatA
MGIIEPWHLLIILVIVLIIFGPGKLPDLGKAMGKTIKEFRQASSTTIEDLQEKAKPAEAQAAKTPEQETPAKTG